MYIHQSVLHLLDRFVSDDVRKQPFAAQLLRARTLVAFLGSMSLLGLVYVPLLYCGTSSRTLGHTAVFACSVNLMLLAAFQRTQSVQQITNLFAGVLLLEIAWSTTLMGGFGASSLAWTALVPLVVTLLCGFIPGLAWTCVAAIVVTTFFVLHHNGIVFPSDLNASESLLVQYVSLLALPLIVVLLCFCYERIRVLAECDARQERDLVKAVLDTNEVDRRLFAFEIHDGVVPLLTGAAMRLDAVVERVAAREQESLSEIRALLSRAIAEARQIMSGLRPPVLDELGIVAGVEFLANDYRQRHGLIVDVTIDQDLGRLPPTTENALFRICQEALTNVVKHSGTNKCNVDLRVSDGRIRLLIRDYGRGAEPCPDGAHRIGLRGIRERAKLLGGEGEVITGLGMGMLIRVAIPIEQPC